MINPRVSDRLTFEEGGLPVRARDRIVAAAEGGSRFFTSTFTASELAVARLAGYEPIGQVMGSSIYHLGWAGYRRSFPGGELENVVTAKRDARARALGRMAEEARLLLAHAVIGVRLGIRAHEWAGGLSEFTALGTAVRVAGAPPPETPALSNLRVQDLYKLELAGLWPVGIVMGNSSWFKLHADCRSDGNWTNQELPDHTACIENARLHATARFKQEVLARAALGAVGVTVERHFHEEEWRENHHSFKAEIVLLGTAVVRRAQSRVPRPRLVLDLGNRKIDLEAAARARPPKE